MSCITSKELKRKRVSDFIKKIRETFGVYADYSKGCYKMYEILKMVFPESIAYYNVDHVMIKIDDRFYDINYTNGLDDSWPELKSYLPLEEYGEDIIASLK